MRLVEERVTLVLKLVIRILRIRLSLGEDLPVGVERKRLRPDVGARKLEVSKPPLALDLQRIVPGAADAGVALADIEILRVRPQRLCQRAGEARIRLRETC